MLTAYHRPSCITVDLEAIKSNHRQIMKYLPAHTLSIAVVKANAYGHGAVEVGQALENQVDALAVAIVDEGLELRQAGIHTDILVLGTTPASHAALCADHHIGCSFFRMDWLKEALDILKDHAVRQPLPLHLKVDSGMNRIGVKKLEQAQEMIDFIADYPQYFKLMSIFSHMATADSSSADQRAQVKDQYENFQTYQEKLDLSALSQEPYYHISNSAMALWYPDLTLDAVRLGASLYGFNPSNGDWELPVNLQAAMRLDTAISHVKKMEGGEKVSYGATYEAREDEWIASLPIGYADGWQRDFQSFKVLVDGQFCEMVGRICMDQCMIRLPHYYPIGTTVTLVGENGGQTIRLENLAQHASTIAYELACLFSYRLPRLYK